MRKFISEDEINNAVFHLACRIYSDYNGKSLTILAILNGSLVFLSDLIRKLNLHVEIGLIQAASYKGTQQEKLELGKFSIPDIKGRNVLLLDDIFDTGNTISVITSELAKFEPTSIATAVLLYKKKNKVIRPDYFCFEVPDHFLVGYGLDLDGQFRHLPYLAIA